MSPKALYAIRVGFAALVAVAVSLQASAPVDWNDALQAIVAGVIAAGAYAGVGAVTPLEPKVGRKPPS